MMLCDLESESSDDQGCAEKPECDPIPRLNLRKIQVEHYLPGNLRPLQSFFLEDSEQLEGKFAKIWY